MTLALPTTNYTLAYVAKEQTMAQWVAEDQIVGNVVPAAAVHVRPARDDDIAAIVAVVDENARLGHLLPRSAENIQSSLASWLVAEINGQVVGIGSLVDMSPTLVEVRSLAVLPAYRSYGIGAHLVDALVDQARERGIPTIFALTRAVSFFTRLGFVISARESFPEKVWKDCVVCPLQHHCDETAVVFEMGRELP